MNENADTKAYAGIIEDRLSIELTTHCNIDCAHCFARAGISKPMSLPLSFVKMIIAEGYNVGYRHLHFTGGEPLLWDALVEALDYAFKMGHETVFLNTNGILLTRKLSGKLATYDGVSISVSLEGSRTLHDQLRGNGSYTQTLQGIERALDADIKVSIFTTACKSLLPELPHFADDLYKKFPGISGLILIQLIPPKDGVFSLSEELLEPVDFLQLIDMVSLLNLLGFRTRFLNNPLAYVAAKLLKIHWVARSDPLYSKGSLIVMANRDMCLSHSSRDSFGKYEFGMIEEVLVSDAYREAVAPNETICPSCDHSTFCAENGMKHPLEHFCDIQSDVLYCKKVLDNILL